MWNHVFYIENRSHLLADQSAILMRDSFRSIDINPKYRTVSGALKLKVHKFIALTFDSLCNDLPDPVPIDSHTHNNKKVGETPTPKSPRGKYKCRFILNQPPFDDEDRQRCRKTERGVVLAIGDVLAQGKRSLDAVKRRHKAGNSRAILTVFVRE